MLLTPASLTVTIQQCSANVQLDFLVYGKLLRCFVCRVWSDCGQMFSLPFETLRTVMRLFGNFGVRTWCFTSQMLMVLTVL